MELKLNLLFAFAWDYLLILFYYYLLWFGIHLYLVTANIILTNILKAMLSFNPYCWSALHFTWTPTFCEFMSHYSPQLVERWTCVSSLLLSHTPHRRRTCGSRGAAYRGVRFDLGGVSQLTFWRQGYFRSCYIYLLFCKTSAM
jgi:hypothetical protein